VKSGLHAVEQAAEQALDFNHDGKVSAGELAITVALGLFLFSGAVALGAWFVLPFCGH
jgi:hypothetical protein